MKHYFLLFLFCITVSIQTSIISGISGISGTAQDDLQNNLVTSYINFDESLRTGFSDQEFITMVANKQQKNALEFLKKLYEQNSFLTKLGQQKITPGIPRIIHQIWLGSELPERYKKFQESWKKYHPTWEYKLWTDADVKAFKLINQKAYDKGKNYAEKANVFRYEILERFGGVYVDTDFECFRPFDILHDFYEFYTGMATINRITLINNGLIASIPGHPILKTCIKNINKTNYGFGQMGRNGTIYFGYMVVQACENNVTFDLSKVLILPPTYMYPWPGVGSHKPFQEYILDSSFAVHYWDGSWTKTSEFNVTPPAQRKTKLSPKLEI